METKWNLKEIETGEKNGRIKVTLHFNVPYKGDELTLYFTTYEDFLPNVFENEPEKGQTFVPSHPDRFTPKESRAGNHYLIYGKNGWCFDRDFKLTLEGEKPKEEKKGDLDSILEGLNEGQRKVIEHKEGPLVVVAGAGAGKTHTVIAKVAHQAEREGIDPRRILLTTFTKKAGDELVERLGRFIPRGMVGQMSVGTFHSILLRQLRNWFGEKSKWHNLATGDNGFPAPIKIVAEVMGKWNQLIDSEGVDVEDAEPKYMIGAISYLKNSLVYPGDEKEIAEHFDHPQLPEVYRMYEETKEQLGVVDLDDILSEFYWLLANNSEFRKSMTALYDWVFVDEAQDNNKAQINIATILSEKTRNLILVGDDWQSIYRFRGAVPEYMIDYEKHYPGARRADMLTNYRSVPEVVDLGNVLIKHNKRQLEKTCNAFRKSEGNAPIVITAMDPMEEAERIGDIILDEKLDHGSTAVIYRTNAHAAGLETALIRRRIPYTVAGGIRFFKRFEVRAVVAYVGLAAGDENDEYAKYVYNLPRRGLGRAFAKQAERKARSQGISFLEVIRQSVNDSRYGRGCRDFLATIDRVKEFSLNSTENHSVDRLIQGACGVILNHLESGKKYKDDEIDNSKAENVMALEGVSQAFASFAPEEFLRYATEAASSNVFNQSKGVVLMTAHRSKGLEFPNVFVAGCNMGLFPHFRALQEENGIEEERRLMYVALTRAKNRLWFLTTREDSKGRPASPSDFLYEMGIYGRSDGEEVGE